MLKYVISSIVLILLDGCYLYLLNDYFSRQIKDVQGSKLKLHLGGAILTYIVLIFGLNYFIIRENRSITDAALLGGVIYFVYEGTNLAIFDRWRIQSVLLDGLWGSALFAMTTFITYKVIV